MSAPFFSIENLAVSFATQSGAVEAVRGVSFTVDAGEIFALVGESGSGKSATVSAAIRLEPENARLSGRILLEGRDLLTLPPRVLRGVRGGRIGMVFQDALSALNPMETIGSQIIETLRAHGSITREAAQERAKKLLREVGIPDPDRRLNLYPHEFSGGMRQRALIAMMLSCNPELLIADEPTTALDVTLQAQILDLLKRLVDTRGMAVILITHDMGVVAELADRVAVMRRGRIVETATTKALFARPTHPYTRTLLDALSRPDVPRGDDGAHSLAPGGALPHGMSMDGDSDGTLTPLVDEPEHLVECQTDGAHRSMEVARG